MVFEGTRSMAKNRGVKHLRSYSPLLGITKWSIQQDRPAERDENGNILLKASGGVHMKVACAAHPGYDGTEFVIYLVKSGKGAMSTAHHVVGTVHAITGITKCVCREGRFEFNLVVWAMSMLENNSSFYLCVRPVSTCASSRIAACTEEFKVARHDVKALAMQAASQMYKFTEHSGLELLASVADTQPREKHIM